MTRSDETITVAVVNDERDARELVAARLEHESERLRTWSAATAEETLERFEDGGFDCIVSDYHMDGMNGVELLERVRERDREFPFLILTQTGDERIASRAISAGVTDYIVRDLPEDQYELLAEKVVRAVEYRRAEREAEETEQRLHELADHANDVMWMFSADWNELLFVNSAYEELFGEPPEVLSENPTSFLSHVHPDDRERVRQGMAVASEGESARVTYRISREDEEGPRWLESQAEPIVEDGAVQRVVGYSRDVTERKRSQEALEEKNARLDMFTSVVAHDLRNPLNVAQGYLELARDTDDLGKLDAVERAHDRMEHLITDLLTLARRGDQINERERVDLESLVRTHWENVTEWEAATLRVENDGALRCDPSRLGQALENLFRNAVEHAGEGVTVTVGLLDGSGFYVEDDGPGIPEEKRERLLSGEYREDTDDVRLGLAIVERIVDAHGWDITITESETGGARFEITGADVFENEA